LFGVDCAWYGISSTKSNYYHVLSTSLLGGDGYFSRGINGL
jgi:hypothetical protein